MTFEEARQPILDLEVRCATLRRCRQLRPEDLAGKYKKAYDREVEACRDALKRSIMEAAPFGLYIWERNKDSAQRWMDAFRDSPEYNGRLKGALDAMPEGNLDEILEFLRWCRKQIEEIAHVGGSVDTGGEKILE